MLTRVQPNPTQPKSIKVRQRPSAFSKKGKQILLAPLLPTRQRKQLENRCSTYIKSNSAMSLRHISMVRSPCGETHRNAACSMGLGCPCSMIHRIPMSSICGLACVSRNSPTVLCGRTLIPSSSRSSRIIAASSVSADSTLPPGNSHFPECDITLDRFATRYSPISFCIRPATTRTLVVVLLKPTPA